MSKIRVPFLGTGNLTTGQRDRNVTSQRQAPAWMGHAGEERHVGLVMLAIGALLLAGGLLVAVIGGQLAAIAGTLLIAWGTASVFTMILRVIRKDSGR